ncbi:hypothetical protein SAMN05445850_7960 [Paraburkholderia tuberum]|uniref:Uncharacterized protein n=1 Tax=Paraburkholderia tuberum TaxID=157910 RepID=A0A1H1KJ45_9BURK|nr:hypothetical protein SAMN05445850_7960 [Paraburkholderia tuberum]
MQTGDHSLLASGDRSNVDPKKLPDEIITGSCKAMDRGDVPWVWQTICKMRGICNYQGSASEEQPAEINDVVQCLRVVH